MRRKILAVVMCLSMVIGVCGCGNTSETANNAKSTEEIKKTESEVEKETEVTEEDETTEEVKISEEEVNEDVPIISNYSIVRDDFSCSTNSGKKIVMYFDKVVFEGSDDSIIYWLNGQVESLENTYQSEYQSNIEQELENLEESSYDTSWEFEPHELKHIYYDDQYASIGWSCKWYGGGVGDTTYEYVNYNLSTKAEVTLYDLLGDNAYNIIVEALNKEDESGTLSGNFDIAMVDSVPFYFDEDTVYINFPDYMLGVSWSVEITVKRLINNSDEYQNLGKENFETWEEYVTKFELVDVS